VVHIRLLCLSWALALTPGLSSSQRLWQGESGGFQITWSSAALAARQSGGAPIAFDAVGLSKAKWQNLTSGGDAEKYSAEFDYKLLSVVGPIASIEYGEECDCGGAHPMEFTGFSAFNLSKSDPQKPVSASLLDYFSPEVLYAALMNNEVVQAILHERKPPSFSALSDILEKDGNYTHSDCEYAFGSDFVQHFAFYDARPAVVDVRISLSHAVETCRGSFIQVGLELPVTDATLKTSLAEAKLGRHGILMKELRRKVGPDSATTVSFPVPR